MKEKVKPVKCQLSWLHLPAMKEMARKMVEANISLLEFNLQVYKEDEQAIDEMQRQLFTSQKALKRIEEIENVETLNYLMVGIIGVKRWLNLSYTLFLMSSALASDECYKADKEQSARNVKSKGGDA